MIVCEPSENGFMLSGLSVGDLEMIEEGLCMIFNQSLKEEHRHFRHQALGLFSPIIEQLDKFSTDKNELTLF